MAHFPACEMINTEKKKKKNICCTKICLEVVQAPAAIQWKAGLVCHHQTLPHLPPQQEVREVCSPKCVNLAVLYTRNKLIYNSSVS